MVVILFCIVTGTGRYSIICLAAALVKRSFLMVGICLSCRIVNNFHSISCSAVWGTISIGFLHILLYTGSYTGWLINPVAILGLSSVAV